MTGAAGQIGSELIPALREHYGSDLVIASDIRVPSFGTSFDGFFEHVDCTHIREIDHAVRRHEVGAIYHLAALLSAVEIALKAASALLDTRTARNHADEI